MLALRSFGTLLQDSGWTGALTKPAVASSRTTESFLSASGVTRTLKVHHITACSLYKLMQTVYAYYSREAENPDELLNF